MRVRRSRSLATQLTGRVAALILMVLFSTVLAIGLGSSMSLMASQRQMQHQSLNAARDFDLFLNEIVTDLQATSTTLTYQNAEVGIVLRDALSRNEAVFELALIDMDGQILAQRRRASVSDQTRVEAQPWLKPVLENGIYWSAIDTGDYGVPFIDLALPVYARQIDENGYTTQVFIGTLLAQIDLTAFWSEVSAIRVGETGYAYLVNQDGTLLAYRDLSLVRQNRRMQDLTGRDPAAVVDGGNNILNGVHDGLGGERVIAAAAPLSTIPWVAVVEQPLGEAFGDFYEIALLSTLSMLFSLLLLYLIWRFMRREVVMPLLALATTADKLRRGDLDHRVDFEQDRAEDEVMLLARTFNDMATAIQMRTRELVIANEKAEESARLKSEFLSNISHELRTPLNAIIGFTGIILEDISGNADRDARHMLERVDANSRRLLHLINEVLDISKIEAGRMELAYHEFNPQGLLDACQQEMGVLAEQQGLQFQIERDPDLPPTLYGDRDRIMQIVTNLLSNAIKFTPKGQVRLAVTWKQSTLTIQVSDTGIGIPPHAVDLIFDPFRQVDGSTRRSYGGTGLGLAIVDNLVTMMRGKISVESIPGAGSTFTVKLPLGTNAPSSSTIIPIAAQQTAD